jgi:hypothetical protein
MTSRQRRLLTVLLGIVVIAGSTIFFLPYHKRDNQSYPPATIAPPTSSPAPTLLPATHPPDAHAVIPKGLHSTDFCTGEDLKAIKQAYPDFDETKCRVEHLSAPQEGYAAYRCRDKVGICWTKEMAHLKKGERVITDGNYILRARCGNAIFHTLPPGEQTETSSPSPGELEIPESPETPPTSETPPTVSVTPVPPPIAPIGPSGGGVYPIIPIYPCCGGGGSPKPPPPMPVPEYGSTLSFLLPTVLGLFSLYYLIERKKRKSRANR